MSTAKADILARVRSALGDTPVPDVRRSYRAAGSISTDGIVDLFCETVAEYRATVHRTSDVAATVRVILGEGKRVGVPVGFRDLGLPVIEDHDLSVAELDALDAVVTGSALAIADTGTIVLVSGVVAGRRALTLVPDHHVCIVEASSVVASVPDAIAALGPDAPLTFVSGPSATSDIELDRVEGVHGPRHLDVIVVE
ncbi:LUD domain-containing protein [Solirubrobacter taibaiensis]|nr:LUD domain-containing protein [Solirubrobacter taibaiensis]